MRQQSSRGSLLPIILRMRVDLQSESAKDNDQGVESEDVGNADSKANDHGQNSQPKHRVSHSQDRVFAAMASPVTRAPRIIVGRLLTEAQEWPSRESQSLPLPVDA
jgi:hypothetical protein